ncbi:MAG: MotA/TolQ/ExbB proton channel family protein [Pseudomonadota bacterium]
MKKLLFIAALSFSAVVQAAPQGLDELLKQVQQGSQASAKMNAEREARFMRDKNEQAAMLAKAEADLAAANARISRVKGRYDASQAEIKALKEKLQTRVGDTGQMYASVRQAAGDFRGAAAGSLVTAQYPQRIDLLEDLMKGTELPSVAKLEKFWFLLQQEMTEGGKVARFSAEVVDEDGARAKADVIRIGVFDAFADGQYLAMQTDGSLSVLPRQPGHGATGLAKSFAKSSDPIEPIIVDPSHGTLLALESARPTIGERLHMGGFVGYVIIFIGLVGAAIAAYQLTFLIKVGRLIHLQLANLRQPNLDNPLGRVLSCLTDEISADPEVVELHVSEAVLRETPKIERFQGLIRLIVAAGPLLGLLGTVIGMIETFQVITEVGAGDPKVMAGGISQAMIATVLGLGIAIPLLFVNTLLMSRSRALVQILDEQSAGMLAQRMETARAANA